MRNPNFCEAEVIGSAFLAVLVIIAAVVVNYHKEIIAGFKSCLKAIGF